MKNLIIEIKMPRPSLESRMMGWRLQWHLQSLGSADHKWASGPFRLCCTSYWAGHCCAAYAAALPALREKYCSALTHHLPGGCGSRVVEMQRRPVRRIFDLTKSRPGPGSITDFFPDIFLTKCWLQRGSIPGPRTYEAYALPRIIRLCQVA